VGCGDVSMIVNLTTQGVEFPFGTGDDLNKDVHITVSAVNYIVQKMATIVPGTTQFVVLQNDTGFVAVNITLPITPDVPTFIAVSESFTRIYIFWYDVFKATGRVRSVVMYTNTTAALAMWDMDITDVNLFLAKSPAAKTSDTDQIFEFATDPTQTCKTKIWYSFSQTDVAELPGGNENDQPSYFDPRIMHQIILPQTDPPINQLWVYDYKHRTTVQEFGISQQRLNEIMHQAGPDNRGWIGAIIFLVIVIAVLVLVIVILSLRIKCLSRWKRLKDEEHEEPPL